jgi:hypothetical protein
VRGTYHHHGLASGRRQRQRERGRRGGGARGGYDLGLWCHPRRATQEAIRMFFRFPSKVCICVLTYKCFSLHKDYKSFGRPATHISLLSCRNFYVAIKGASFEYEVVSCGVKHRLPLLTCCLMWQQAIGGTPLHISFVGSIIGVRQKGRKPCINY